MMKTYEQKTKAWKATNVNMAHLEILGLKYELSKDISDATLCGILAARSARWVFTAYPELRG